MIGKMIIHIEFIVMDIRENTEISILLGRHFLATIGTIIDVKCDKLTLEVGHENVEFLLSKLIEKVILLRNLTTNSTSLKDMST